MSLEDSLFQVLMYTLPSVIVFLTAFNVLKKFLEQQQQDKMVGLKKESLKTVLPLRLQSVERLVLFLERIAPENMIIRIHTSGISARQLHKKLIDTIQSEFEHNMVQQVYVSEKAWEEVRIAKDETIRTINLAYNKMKNDSPGLDLSQEVFRILSQVGESPSYKAIRALKRELKKYF